MKKPYAVVFAGVPGSSKTIIAYHLSLVFSLPIFSTDNIRNEVKEDLQASDIREPRALAEYEKRQGERWKELLAKKEPFIRDASVDRSWKVIKDDLEASGYSWCLIDMELSKDFLVQLYTLTGRQRALEQLDVYLKQHQDFMKQYSAEVSVMISDKDFLKRRQIAEATVKQFIKGL